MQIFLMVIQLLSYIAPAVARMLAAINESKDGGIKGYDKLLVLAEQGVKQVAAEMAKPSTMPGADDENKWDTNLRLYASAIYKTIDLADAAGVVYKDHQITQAVSDAYTAWKMASAPNSNIPTLEAAK